VLSSAFTADMNVLAAGLLFRGFIIISATGQEREEDARKDEDPRTFRQGSQANLTVRGEVTVGCRITLYPEDGMCCYSARGKENLCSDTFQPKNCPRGPDSDIFVEEREDACILLLPDFQLADAGLYHVSDDGNQRLNQEITLSMRPTPSLKTSNVSVSISDSIPVVMYVIVIGICAAAAWWFRRDGKNEFKIECNIMHHCLGRKRMVLHDKGGHEEMVDIISERGVD